jgi:alpha-1,2-mannosyltransferase
MIDLLLSLSFWITAIVVAVWLTVSVLKFCITNTAEEHRAQLLQELGPSALNIQQPQFLGFFHPYWYVSQ